MEIAIGPAVRAALDAGRPVVALESTIVAHGLPRPDNLRVAREVEQLVTQAGAVPATVGIVAGVPTVGLDDDQLALLAEREDVAKLGVRDIAPACAAGIHGATTVASTAHLAATAGVEVFATGGIGGVHRGAGETWDVSADLRALASTGVVVVCAGVKSILDVPATMERLETLGVPVVGYGTDELPGFYLRATGHGLDWRVDAPGEVAEVFRAQVALGLGDRALLVMNPLPPHEALDATEHDRLLTEALAAAERAGVTGKDVTPHVLAHLHAASGGATLRANEAVIRGNAELAARIAVALRGPA